MALKGGKPRIWLFREIKDLVYYQFGECEFLSILDNQKKIKLDFSRKTGKIKNVYYNNERLLTYKPQTGSFNLSIIGAQILHKSSRFPSHRVQIINGVTEYIRNGNSVFAKHIVQMDENLRYGSEVLVVDESDNLIAIGKLTIPSYLYAGKDVGQAVAIRKSIKVVNNIENK